MIKSKALDKLDHLHQRFEADFTPEYLNTHITREEWLRDMSRLVIDIFGLGDPLLKSVQPLSILSEEFERRTVSIESRRRKGEEWYSKVALWLNRVSWNISNTSKLTGGGALTDEPLISRVVWLSAVAGLILLTHLATVEYENYKKDQSRLFEQSRVVAEFHSWIASLPIRQGQSYSGLRITLSEQGLNEEDAAYWSAIQRWMVRQRLDMTAARSLYMARVASLGGDTTLIDAPTRVTVKPVNAPDILGLDTL